MILKALFTVALPKSWGKMGLQDATKVVQLGSRDIDFTNVSLKFQAEAAGTFTSIVKVSMSPGKSETFHTCDEFERDVMEFFLSASI